MVLKNVFAAAGRRLLLSTGGSPIQLSTLNNKVLLSNIRFRFRCNATTTTTASSRRCLSTTTGINSNIKTVEDNLGSMSPINPAVFETDEKKIIAFDLTYKKLKPYIVKRRLNKMKTYIGEEKGIRHSPWRMNLVCQLVAGLPLVDAIEQLQFSKKKMAPLVQKVLIRTSNLADIRDNIQPSQLEVAECFATKGSHLKRMKIMGRGRTGIMHHKFTHIRLILREIDFKLKIYQAKSKNQKMKWYIRQQRAQMDADIAKEKRIETEQLEREAAARKAKREQEESQ